MSYAVNISFEGKVALVTGAGSGIGLATAEAFAKDSVRTAAERLLAAGWKVLAIRCNVADRSEVAATVGNTVSAFGRLDAAFNNAGINSDSDFFSVRM